MKTIKTNTIMKLSRIAIVAFITLAFTIQANAQTCNAVIKSKTGVVLSANPARITFRATSNQVKVKINKTGGKAKTTVNIYANGQFKDRMIFENGRDTPTKSKTINGVNGKDIRVDIVNQSVGNTFKYSMTGTSRTSNLSKSGRVTGRLIGQQKKTIYTKSSCTNKTRVIIKRTSGKARGTVRIWKKSGNSWISVSSDTFERNEPGNKKEFVINTSRELKIELKNISVGNKFFYEMDAKVSN